jgi:predicted phosphodiesterase
MASKNYEAQIAAGLQKVYGGEPLRLDFNVETDKWVIFSDQHRGARDGADDFARCEQAYNAALGYYYEKGYTLVVLGDAEELWESSPKKVLKAYANTLSLEGQFHARGRYYRCFGNHDADWRRASAVRKHLQKIFGPQLHVHEGLRVSVRAAGIPLGQIFLVHGHQGTVESDQYMWISRIAVRYGWGFIQRLFRIRSTTPAKDFALRHKHNVAMYRWVERLPDTVLIAGHTHRPVFASRNKLALLMAELEAVRAKLRQRGDPPPHDLVEQAAALRARIEACRVQETSHPSGEAPLNQARPCYFNTGCCSFSDGDVTALEIADGAIRLVRWPDNNDAPSPQILDSADLPVVFNKPNAVMPSPRLAGDTN